MKCPRCRQSSLQEEFVKEKDLTVDRCPKCKGIWFDRGELSRLLAEAPGELQIPRNAVRLQSMCPRCDRPLYAFHYPQTRVTVEMCKRCAGFWLDQGEFSQIRKARECLPQQSEPDGQTDVDGVKGALIRFIDWALDGLMP